MSSRSNGLLSPPPRHETRVDERELDLERHLAPARAGDSTAIDALLRALQPIVRDIVRRRMGSRPRRWAESGDLVQEVLVEIVDDLPSLPEVDAVPVLIARVHRRTEWRIRDLVRRHRRDATESATPEHDRDPAMAPATQGDVTRADQVHYLRRLIDMLPKKYAEVVRLRTLEGLSYDQIAERLGLPPDTVRKRYSRARESLVRREVFDLLPPMIDRDA